VTKHVMPPPAQLQVEPMQKLAEHLTNLVPPPVAAPLLAPELPKPSAAVTAALEKSAKMAAQARRKAARRSRPLSVRLVEAFVTACGFLPYALVALAVRFVVARSFFLDAQTKFRGPQLSFGVFDFDFSVMIPTELKAQVVTSFASSLPQLPAGAAPLAYVVSYAEFILPIMLVLGFGTRFAALLLLGITALMAVYLSPQALWSVHIYWGAMLLVLLSLGGGVVSVDGILRRAVRR
jgi:putative oxidoreductase